MSMDGETVSGCMSAIELFQTIPGWKDSDERIERCNQKIKEILHAPTGSSPPLRLDEFLKIWNAATELLPTQISSGENSSASPAEDSGNFHKIGISIFVFLLAVFSSFIFTYMRKR